MADIVCELESAAEILLAPPNVITSEQRHCAEAVFLNFQKTKSPFQLCQFILANSKSDYVQFQAATLIKYAIIREWKHMPKLEVEQLQAGLLNFVIENTGLQSYIKEQLLLVVVVMVKRTSVEDRSEIVGEFLTEVSHLISSGDSAVQTIGCSILTALMNEYAFSGRATDVGLTWEAHATAKKIFESTDLKRLFQFCLQRLSVLNKIGTSIAPATAKLFKKFLMIAEQILTWNFEYVIQRSKRAGLCRVLRSTGFKPKAQWRDVFLDPDVIQLFFKLHWQVRDNPDLCHHTLQCFHQLASLDGCIIDKEQDKILYLGWILENLLQLLTSGPLKDYETIGISNMINRLHMFFPGSCIAILSPNIVHAYLAELTNMVCLLAECAAQEELLQDDKIYMEAFEHILEAWSIILKDHQHYPEELIKQSSVQIFNQYLKTHLSPPDGSRSVNMDDKEEIDEIEEDDRLKYFNQLSVVGLFARMILDHSIPILVRLLEDRIIQLHGQLQRIHQQSGTANDTTILEHLNEDIHWLVMVAGHVLTTVTEYESSPIPPKVIQYCLTQSESINMETTLNVLVSPNQRVTDIPNAELSTDPVVRLIAAVFRLCEVEKRALEASLIHLMSPEVALTCIWFLGQFSVTYLLPEDSYEEFCDESEISLSLTQAFGKDTEASLWALDYVIGKFESNLLLWQSESKVVIESVQTLSVVFETTERRDKAIHCPSLLSLVKKQSAGNFQTLPTAAKRVLLKSLVIVGTETEQKGVKDQYWEELLKPLQEKFQFIMCSPNFVQTYQNKQVQMEVLDMIECLTGVVDGSEDDNLNNLLPVINPLFDEIVKLVDLYHNYSLIVSSIFQVFCVAAQRILYHLSRVDTKKLYECCVNVIRIYAKHNSGQTSREASNEEEKYQDILVLMQLLSYLMHRDFRDFHRTPSGSYVRLLPRQETEEELPSAGEVVVYGLDIIMTVMNTELMNFPNLCVQYYKLIASVCKIHPSKAVELPENLLKPLINSVQLGLTSYTTEVTSLCFDIITSLGTYLRCYADSASPGFATLEPFLKIVLDMLLQQPLDADLNEAASTALHVLIICFQDRFKELVEELINSQSDPATAQRLIASFNCLCENMSLNLDRECHNKFRGMFEKFITDVQGYMCVK